MWAFSYRFSQTLLGKLLVAYCSLLFAPAAVPLYSAAGPVVEALRGLMYSGYVCSPILPSSPAILYRCSRDGEIDTFSGVINHFALMFFFPYSRKCSSISCSLCLKDLKGEINAWCFIGTSGFFILPSIVYIFLY